MVDVQAVIQALIRANESPEDHAAHERKPVITFSRDHGCGGDEIAHALAEKLGLPVYDKQILEAVAKHADVNKSLMAKLHESVSAASDAWLYSMIFGKNVTRDHYKQSLVTAIRGIYRTGGVIIGRGAHVVLAGRDVLRVRIIGSADACAKRLAHERHLDLVEARQQVREHNSTRGKYVWNTFKSRLNDPVNFDLTINTDHFTHYRQVVDLLAHAASVLGVGKSVSGTSRK